MLKIFLGTWIFGWLILFANLTNSMKEDGIETGLSEFVYSGVVTCFICAFCCWLLR